jgi:hypothetical protein
MAGMLDELIDRYSEVAVLTVRPYIVASGEILRWVVEIDGKEPADMDVRIEQRDPWVVMFLVRGNEEIEIGRWSGKRHPDGAPVIWTLGTRKSCARSA